MSSSTLVHSCWRTQLCSLGYKVEQFSPSDDDDDEIRRKRIRRINSSLPDDILAEILLRLPAKALFQFRHADEYWYNLIRSPKFISTHFATHEEDRLSLCCHSYGRKGKSTITFLFSDIPLDLTAPIFFDHPKIVGCCFGLVCLSLYTGKDTGYLLWNPATGDFRRVDVDVGCCPASTAWVYSGLYFDHAENTRKIARISILRTQLKVYLDVFTIGSNDNTWNKKKKELAFPCELLVASTDIIDQTCIGRFMYWVIDFSDEKRILCFDMGDELFQRIEFPWFEHGPRPYTVLAEYKESLAMFVWNGGAFTCPGQSFDMWLLNDCGGSSWSKKLTLTPSLPDVQAPIGFYVKGDVELVVFSTDRGQYLLWNADSGEATKIPWEDGYIGQFFVYSQSLASVR